MAIGRTALIRLVACVALLAAPAASAAAPKPADSDRSIGIWRNPQNSVHVRSDHCGTGMCGTVVWASEKAKADARRGGTHELVGLVLFKDFRPAAKGGWRGKVYVPDIGKTFSGTISVIDANTLRGTGCLVGRVGCRSQIWTRIE